MIDFMTTHLTALGVEAPNRFWERIDMDFDSPTELPAQSTTTD